jgi:hypothetical protein
VEAGREHAIPVVREYNAGHTRSHSLAEFLETIKNDRGLEGCVLRFDDGAMFKIKTLWYHNLNRGLHMMTKTKTNNEKFMWRIILDHKYDDMKVYISVDERCVPPSLYHPLSFFFSCAYHHGVLGVRM